MKKKFVYSVYKKLLEKGFSEQEAQEIAELPEV